MTMLSICKQHQSDSDKDTLTQLSTWLTTQKAASHSSGWNIYITSICNYSQLSKTGSTSKGKVDIAPCHTQRMPTAFLRVCYSVCVQPWNSVDLPIRKRPFPFSPERPTEPVPSGTEWLKTWVALNSRIITLTPRTSETLPVWADKKLFCSISFFFLA